uniref:Uncharacterized protein n=1 Tax=Cannabis sativa TaxID=3483 RepID=A0A803PHG0_CANSA
MQNGAREDGCVCAKGGCSFVRTSGDGEGRRQWGQTMVVFFGRDGGVETGIGCCDLGEIGCGSTGTDEAGSWFVGWLLVRSTSSDGLVELDGWLAGLSEEERWLMMVMTEGCGLLVCG